uniref:Uncharacterized protein n=1 Tax=uncultured marine virus TaxID=186617 RepID=A0A0F7LA26_9VIRU|nr:hypothetical protein [uncultured marine virus]
MLFLKILVLAAHPTPCLKSLLRHQPHSPDPAKQLFWPAPCLQGFVHHLLFLVYKPPRHP